MCCLGGDIETVSLEAVIQVLCDEIKTGILKVENGKEVYHVYLLRGSVVYAKDSSKRTRLGQLLLRDNVITKDELKRCMAHAKENKLALGRTLVQAGLITQETLEEYIYYQVKEIFTIIFLWDAGTFEFKEANFDTKWLAVMELNTMHLIMDGIKARDQMRK
jgi:hypothetical protein